MAKSTSNRSMPSSGIDIELLHCWKRRKHEYQTGWYRQNRPERQDGFTYLCAFVGTSPWNSVLQNWCENAAPSRAAIQYPIILASRNDPTLKHIWLVFIRRLFDEINHKFWFLGQAVHDNSSHTQRAHQTELRQRHERESASIGCQMWLVSTILPLIESRTKRRLVSTTSSVDAFVCFIQQKYGKPSTFCPLLIAKNSGEANGYMNLSERGRDNPNRHGWS
jgi:hypothetical protein